MGSLVVHGGCRTTVKQFATAQTLKLAVFLTQTPGIFHSTRADCFSHWGQGRRLVYYCWKALQNKEIFWNGMKLKDSNFKVHPVTFWSCIRNMLSHEMLACCRPTIEEQSASTAAKLFRPNFIVLFQATKSVGWKGSQEFWNKIQKELVLGLAQSLYW